VNEVAADDGARLVRKRVDAGSVSEQPQVVMNMVCLHPIVLRRRGGIENEPFYRRAASYVLLAPPPPDRNGRVRDTRDLVVGDDRTVGMTDKHGDGTIVLEPDVMNVVVHDRVGADHEPRIVRMMIGALNASNLHRRSAEVVEVAADDGVVVGAEPEPDRGRSRARERAPFGRPGAARRATRPAAPVNNFNYGRFVGEVIESALAQTHPRCEVIVVDDGSTDDSRSVIERFGSRVVPLFQANGGQGAAMNAGFARSRGEVAFAVANLDIREVRRRVRETLVAAREGGVPSRVMTGGVRSASW
jgi:hypothetical protein